jgi:thiosulfate/3-mercaptopyruvate sulfurtransferase
MSALISTHDLNAQLGDASSVILNGSWHMPSEKCDARKEHANAHIPRAVFFDIDAISDQASPYPHMLPSAQAFSQAVSALGISNNSDIVVYDSNGLFSAARVWWMFRVFGHSKVRVLDGGFPKWLAEKRPVESGVTSPKMAHFDAVLQPNLIRTFEQITENTQSHKEQVMDARSSGRFNGTEPEPRAGLRSGHITGSTNIPFRECTAPPFHTLKSPAELKALFAAHGVVLDRPITATCGSGVTACILALALYEVGVRNVPVYDGAWAQWASRTS